ncbi:biopolymer transporter ExbD [Chelativorans salis]|uniref:Biopolymer transporter ExbD n=1 Tax=Chelativorans salis TaxID=2978478 RepID=A0ABT2LL24_9HYPH|nr:biopolymer transporter ExbD [Chelativorans sp. EGI FJ00035]MCT7375290.1 biopolymer transporter ExbD [Chelativorans sp. EGI FJ00035]
MRIDLAVPRHRPLSLTPLIDVIFLLLLFFMLSSTFMRFAEVEVTGGTASAGAAAEAPDVLIRIDGGDWQVNGVSAGVEEAVTELKRLQEQGAARAVLLVRGEVTSQELVTAIERIRGETTLSLTVAR